MNPIHVIAHYRGDLDGLACHGIANRWFNQKGNLIYDSIEHHDIVYGRENEAFELIKPHEDLFFCDLGFNLGDSYKKAIEKLINLKKSGSNLSFFDHHDWPNGLVEKIFKHISHDKKNSSAPQLAKYLIPEDDVSKYLGELAYLDDRNKSQIIGKTLTDLLNAKEHYDPIDLINHLGQINNQNEILPKETELILSLYSIDLNLAKEKLRHSYQSLNICETSINFGLGSELLFMKPGHRIMREDFNLGINFCFFEGLNNVMFRANNLNEYRTIVETFGGGGRNNEGGFYLINKSNLSNYKSQIEFVYDKLKNKLN